MGTVVGATECDPALVLDAPEMREAGGIVYIIRNGTCRAAMPMHVFESYIASGTRLIKAFHAKHGQNVEPLRKKAPG